MSHSTPAHPGYFADPFVWRHDEIYCAIGTGGQDAFGTAATGPAPSIFPLLVSSDLARWEPAGHALVRPDPTLGDTFWAPEIVQAGGTWYLYYSVGHEDRRHQLRVATSGSALGPYLDTAQLTDPDVVPFAIDPHPFRDADGRWYLFHARDFLDASGSGKTPVRAGTGLAVQRLRSMTELDAGGPRTVVRARFDWQRFAANRPMYSGVFDWHTLEGPFVVKRRDRYYCLYSGGCWQTESYGVDYAVADHVLGPYSDEGAQSGPRILRTVPGKIMGPGHCSVVTTQGGLDYLAYHAWDPEYAARRLHIEPIVFSPGGPRLATAGCRRQPLPESQRAH